jgi:hypothetical protein
MSRSVDLFVDADMSLEEMAAALGGHAGSALVADGHARWVLREGPVQATLAEHPYGDDGELLFTRYRFALSARVDNDGRPQDSPEAGLLRRIAQKIAQGPAWPVLVVLDLQYRDRPGADQGAIGTEAAAPAEAVAPAVDGAG